MVASNACAPAAPPVPTSTIAPSANARDKNHSSVIKWSVANEPRSDQPGAKAFFRHLFDLAKSMNQTRPVTLESNQGAAEESVESMDSLALNRYYGWYTLPRQIEVSAQAVSQELDALYAKFHKPLIFAEFGADALHGWPATESEMFNKEFQVGMILRDLELLRSKPFAVGEHVWNMCDFKIAQGVRRVNGMNDKGILTRDR